jgi:hypothetical protein
MERRTSSAAALLLASIIAPSSAHARPFNYTFKSKYAELEFSWSGEAAAIPALVRRLRAELASEKKKTIEGGRQEFAIREDSGSAGVGWQSITKITTSGETSRLLSLSRQYYAFTGGAHGNGATTGFLWDRALAREIKFASLFSSPDRYTRVLRGPYCEALDAERKKRRGGDGKLGNGISEFDACPKLSDLALIPSATRHGGRFVNVHLIAAAYLAGPYAEGEYDIVLPVPPQLVRLIKPQYRSSFQAQRQ